MSLGIDSSAGNGAGGGDVIRKLVLVRRKSLQFAPRVGSPLRGDW